MIGKIAVSRYFWKKLRMVAMSLSERPVFEVLLAKKKAQHLLEMVFYQLQTLEFLKKSRSGGSFLAAVY